MSKSAARRHRDGPVSRIPSDDAPVNLTGAAEKKDGRAAAGLRGRGPRTGGPVAGTARAAAAPLPQRTGPARPGLRCSHSEVGPVVAAGVAGGRVGGTESNLAVQLKCYRNARSSISRTRATTAGEAGRRPPLCRPCPPLPAPALLSAPSLLCGPSVPLHAQSHRPPGMADTSLRTSLCLCRQPRPRTNSARPCQQGPGRRRGGGASPGLNGAPQSERRSSGDDASAAAGCRGRRDRPAATAADADPRQRARRRRALCPLCSACAQRRRGGAGGRVRLSDDSEGRPAPGAQLPRARSGPEPHCPRRTPSPRRTGTPAPHPAVRRLTRGGRPRQW